MTTPIKTQCPHCHACLKIQKSQLNQAKATVECDHCHQRFLVNKHLIVTPDASNTATTEADTIKTNISGQSNLNGQPSKEFFSDTLIHDDLIHDDMIYDDMDTDGPAETTSDYDSLDSMDAWLTQTSHTDTSIDEPSNNTPKTTNKNSRSSVKLSPSPAVTKHPSSQQSALSSTEANDLYANVDNFADNSWLEKLLIEQNKSESMPQDDTDLSQLLIDMGVSLKDEDNLSEERIRKAQAQKRFAPTSEKHSIASLLWALGCLVLALLLFAQYVIFNLDNLVKNPVYAQRLQAICSIAACSLPSADLSAFAITNASHKASQVQTTGAFSDVSATLNNQSAKSQLYPNVKVSVYGADNLIGEFIAAPNDYLLSKQSQLAAESDRQLLLTIPIANAQIREVTLLPMY